jgi:hypothetical protein
MSDKIPLGPQAPTPPNIGTPYVQPSGDPSPRPTPSKSTPPPDTRPGRR